MVAVVVEVASSAGVATAAATKVAEEMEVGTLVEERRVAMMEVWRVEVTAAVAAKAPEGEVREEVVRRAMGAVVAISCEATRATMAMPFSKRPNLEDENKLRCLAARHGQHG